MKNKKVKYLIVLGDGMADHKDENGQTPLSLAKKPFIDELCFKSELGLVQTVPYGMSPGSDTANLSCLGYYPKVYYTGRSPLEAVSIGVNLSDGDITYRMNFVTLRNDAITDEPLTMHDYNKATGTGSFFGNNNNHTTASFTKKCACPQSVKDCPQYENLIMHDYSAGEIETSEAAKLIEILKPHLPKGFELFAGTSYRHCMVQRADQITNSNKKDCVGAVNDRSPANHKNTNLACDLHDGRSLTAPTNTGNKNLNSSHSPHSSFASLKFTPPHDITDKPITPHLPPEPFLSFMRTSHEILKKHPDNKTKANSVWIWGQGTKPMLTPFKEKFGVKGAVISEVDLIKGIGIAAGMTSIDVEGADGSLHTNYEGMIKAAIKAFDKHDFVYLHIEAPDEMGHKGDKAGKILAIEFLNDRVVKPLVSVLEKKYRLRMLFLPDHATPLALKTHTSEPVPYMLYDSNSPDKKHNLPYAESGAKEAGVFESMGDMLIKRLFS